MVLKKALMHYLNYNQSVTYLQSYQLVKPSIKEAQPHIRIRQQGFRFFCLTLNPLYMSEKIRNGKAKTIESAKPFCAICHAPFVATRARIQFDESFPTQTIENKEKIARPPGGLE